MQSVLSIQQLTKDFGKLRAVNQLDLQINQGEVYGILGPNGSGKTTTLGMIMGVINPTSGAFQWFGEPATKHSRRRIGTLLETPNFYPYMSAWNNLKVSSLIKGSNPESIGHVLQMVNLYERRDSKFKTFSLGMKQRLAVASALLGNPDVLVLDEPTNGLDPQGIAEMRDLIRRIASDGKTIIMASHIMIEVEKTCSHVAIMKRGDLLRSGPISSVLSGDSWIVVAAEDMDLLKTVLRTNEKIKSTDDKGSHLELRVEPGYKTADLNKFLFEQGITPSQLSEETRNLEAEFLELIK